jgi:hypothetical protein
MIFWRLFSFADKVLNLKENYSDKVNGNEPGVFPSVIQNG